MIKINVNVYIYIEDQSCVTREKNNMGVFTSVWAFVFLTEKKIMYTKAKELLYSIESKYTLRT